MRHYPEDDDDRQELEALNAEDWRVELLKLNPSYVWWGPYEDYMSKEGQGWDSRLVDKTVDDMFELDDLNECVNFYFQIGRENQKCATCNGHGYHPDAQWITESFYQHSTPFKSRTMREERAKRLLERVGCEFNDSVINGYPSEEILKKYGKEFREFCEAMQNGDGSWYDKITQDEVQALYEKNRISRKWDGEKWVKGECPTAEDVNAQQHGSALDSHDAINRWILIETRCNRLGVPIHCDNCEGRGYVWTASKAHVNLILWILHPRKGCSRGMEIKNIQKEELPKIFKYLREAADRNAERFSRIPNGV